MVGNTTTYKKEHKSSDGPTSPRGVSTPRSLLDHTSLMAPEGPEQEIV